MKGRIVGKSPTELTVSLNELRLYINDCNAGKVAGKTYQKKEVKIEVNVPDFFIRLLL